MEKDDDSPLTRGVVQISPESELVLDPDEEVFILYSNLQAGTSSQPSSFRGLGHIDSRKDTLTVTLELRRTSESCRPNRDTLLVNSRKRRKPRKVHNDVVETIQIVVAQDKTALRTRKGDTGSILWKASVDFAQLILQQLFSNAPDSLLNHAILNTQHVVELGSGTGLLAIALAPHVRRYTATDIEALLPLIRKNVALNFNGWPNYPDFAAPGSNVFVEELDWNALSSASREHRRKILAGFEPADLILVVDCIYHPSLLPPLIETIDHLAVPGHTAVLIIVELRAEDVVRQFLDLWRSRSQWEIWRVEGKLLDKPYAMWLGWRLAADI